MDGLKFSLRVMGMWVKLVEWSLVWGVTNLTTTWLDLRETKDHWNEKGNSSIGIWLILPVVIRSSQRLSHACVSITNWLWNCEWLIISVIVYLVKDTNWITVVILGLIHEKVLWWGVFIRMKTICFGMIVSNSNLSYRMLNVAMSLSSFCPISFRW